MPGLELAKRAEILARAAFSLQFTDYTPINETKATLDALKAGDPEKKKKRRRRAKKPKRAEAAESAADELHVYQLKPSAIKAPLKRSSRSKQAG